MLSSGFACRGESPIPLGVIAFPFLSQDDVMVFFFFPLAFLYAEDRICNGEFI
jgi:hypothetical protein